MKKLVLLAIVVMVVQWWFKSSSINTPTHDISFNYVVEYGGNAQKEQVLPLLIALHGNGDSIENFYETALTQIGEPIRIVLLEGTKSFGRGKAWPWEKTELGKTGQAVYEAVQQLAVKYPTKGKPMLLGFSGGGMMAYYQALYHGTSYSYVFPVSGKFSQSLTSDAYPSVGAPVIAYHGINDPVVPLAGGKMAITILQTHGVAAQLREFVGDHHGIFTNMKSEISRAIDEKSKKISRQ